jgi:hypothetical protein
VLLRSALLPSVPLRRELTTRLVTMGQGITRHVTRLPADTIPTHRATKTELGAELLPAPYPAPRSDNTAQAALCFWGAPPLAASLIQPALAAPANGF